MTHRIRVGLLFPGERDAAGASPALETTRLRAIAAALAEAGVQPVSVAHDDAAIDAVRRELLALDGVLVWVNPVERGADRARLDALLREVAAAGVLVSAHPDVIDAMGTKDVLHAARDLPFGSDTRRYGSREELLRAFPACLAEGQPRVLKHVRGNGGQQVWKVELIATAPEARVRVRHAARGSQSEELELAVFLQRFDAYFAAGGALVDQRFQERLADGMVRCYFVGRQVAGFGEQLVNALYPAPATGGPAPQPGPRLYYPPTRPDFQRLKEQAESRWLPALVKRLQLSRESLPVIWDADFLYGPRDERGQDSYVLCEINVSCVFPFPDEALAPLARVVRERLLARGISSK
jgi:hypothetical protein